MKQKNRTENNQYPEFDQLNLADIDQLILQYWADKSIFDKSINQRDKGKSFVFYEGPPSANGLPGIHHVMARTVKDIFCRHKTMQGYRVDRKGGWDTHGLPVELSVEKELNITKEDIGKSISVDAYNQKCKETVMRFKDVWDDLTKRMGYWVDLDNPYITFDNQYIESVWWILGELYKKDLLYKGYTIQPYSPAAGTGLSSHELNMPGTYKMVKDTTVVAQFKVVRDDASQHLFSSKSENVYFLAWTTTPWTLPSNTALAVGKKIMYVQVSTYNPYTHQPIQVVLAKELLNKWFKEALADLPLDTYQPGDKQIPFRIDNEFAGEQLAGISYEQLLPYVQPTDGDAFKVILGDFVTTEDGTGIVHIAPSFGADDKRVAEENGIGSLTLVDRQGRFVDGMGVFSGRYVKNYTDDPNYTSVDVDIAIALKKENKAFNVQKYEHTYPHCWRTDKPVLYYPLDSWFIRTTAVKEQLIKNNQKINWKPGHIRDGRFGQWLNELKDWNLSRSRFWGIPLPIWRTEDKDEEICIGSIEELQAEMEKANQLLGITNPSIEDIHRPYIDEVTLVSPNGKPMKRELDVIDVWFDSGSMPYAQWHYPFSLHTLKDVFPADFIAEGIDQTRGWFYTLHAIATMLFDSVAFKNVIANGLVLDKNGQKMSKRLGNAVDPFQTIDTYGADATRWYMIVNAPPWDNLKFDVKGIDEVRRKFFGTLYNTYSFFALYANIDQFTYEEKDIPIQERQEIDRWILSVLNTLVQEVIEAYEMYEPTKAARAIQQFLDDHLSNWYVRLCRRRFWKGDYTKDKIAAYQTLYQCIETVSLLMAPISPFFADWLYTNLNKTTNRHPHESVHLALYPEVETHVIDTDLEERMSMAQTISSLVLSLRKREQIKVRQPLSKIMIPVLDDATKQQIEKVESYILNEVNVKQIEYIKDAAGILVKKLKPDFKKLGPKYGKYMKQISASIQNLTQEDIAVFEKEKTFSLDVGAQILSLSIDEVEVITEDIEGWLVASENNLTVALDVSVTEELEAEGNAREFINRIQNLRKDQKFEVTDRVLIHMKPDKPFQSALNRYKQYICTEILADDILVDDTIQQGEQIEVNESTLTVLIAKR